ncbi:hypothetical protein O181_043226 [Austropuccinia psidii MF-1]|uniref:SNF2 N-terminal domain-containing protein n=1 Tax=Austropuccinia psidii MF-1 TaxID=1389203 RepID=A0A9Q3DN35_9BASI|nr:hypothetical protein [Austropuccinia psidii MF-1]
MSTFYSHVSHFNINANLISFFPFIDFQEKTDTITQWIRPSHDDPTPFHDSNPPPPSSRNRTSFFMYIITNKVDSSFEYLSTNNPLGILVMDDMRLGIILQAIALIGISKERLIKNPQCSMPTIIIYPPFLITNWNSEISKHAQAGALQAKIYHGSTFPSLSKPNILQCDILITSYNTITQEFK